VLPDVYLADRCLHLHVDELGQIVWASKTPKPLFNFEGESCVGKSVFDIVDVLQAWHAAGGCVLRLMCVYVCMCVFVRVCVRVCVCVCAV